MFDKRKGTIKPHFIFGKRNFQLMILGVVFIVVGFLLMSGGKTTDPNVFNDDELFSFRRITLAPIIVLLGFAIEFFAIFSKPEKSE